MERKFTDKTVNDAELYKRLLKRQEDLDDAKLVKERQNGPFVTVRLDEL